MNKEEKDIVEGFNAGYVIRSNEPELYNQLNDSLKDSKSNYFNSFLEGAETYEQ